MFHEAVKLWHCEPALSCVGCTISLSGEIAAVLRRMKKYGLAAAILVLIVCGTFLYLLRGGFRRFETTPYKLPPSPSTNWDAVLSHPRDIALVSLQTGVVHMDACRNLDPESRMQARCDHSPRDLAVLVHWVHHPRFGDFLIDAGFDNSFAKHPPYGNYTEAMALFNWLNGVTNSQQPGEDLGSQLERLNIHPSAVFFTHLHPDHTSGVAALDMGTEFIFAKSEASFLARAAVANHFAGKTKFSALDFSTAPRMAPLGPCVDLFGDGSPGRSRFPVIPTTTSPTSSTDRRQSCSLGMPATLNGLSKMK